MSDPQRPQNPPADFLALLAKVTNRRARVVIDHRTPYEVAGDEGGGPRDPKDYMLLCAACQRSKS